MTARLGQVGRGLSTRVLRGDIGPAAHQLDDELEMPAAGCAVERCPLLLSKKSEFEETLIRQASFLLLSWTWALQALAIGGLCLVCLLCRLLAC